VKEAMMYIMQMCGLQKLGKFERTAWSWSAHGIDIQEVRLWSSFCGCSRKPMRAAAIPISCQHLFAIRSAQD
jgi:hypothetical protein